MRAHVKWPSSDSAARPRFRGKVTITQEGPHHPAHFKVRLKGLNPRALHGFHIHATAMTSLSDLEKTCATCGGHFNPTGQQHGSILNKNPYHSLSTLSNMHTMGKSCSYVPSKLPPALL